MVAIRLVGHLIREVAVRFADGTKVRQQSELEFMRWFMRWFMRSFRMRQSARAHHAWRSCAPQRA